MDLYDEQRRELWFLAPIDCEGENGWPSAVMPTTKEKTPEDLGARLPPLERELLDGLAEIIADALLKGSIRTDPEASHPMDENLCYPCRTGTGGIF
jgi:hypothetical protein